MLQLSAKNPRLPEPWISVLTEAPRIAFPSAARTVTLSV
jgi:hypothetical protein